MTWRKGDKKCGLIWTHVSCCQARCGATRETQGQQEQGGRCQAVDEQRQAQQHIVGLEIRHVPEDPPRQVRQRGGRRPKV